MNKSLTYLIAMGAIASLPGLFSCDGNLLNKCKQNYNFYNDHYLVFYVVDEEGKNLLEIGVNRYQRDEVDILDQDLNPLGYHPDLDGSIVFGFLDNVLRNPEEPLDTPIEHTYYVYFEEGDYDTLDIAYQIGLDKCSDRILTQLSVSYNDSLYINDSSDPREDVGAFFLKSTPSKK